MPELPEMERYRRHLERRCVGLRILKAEVHREKSINTPPAAFAAAVEGTVLSGFGRAGKMLVFYLDGAGLCLLNHLMLGGALFYGTDAEAPRRTFQVILRLSGGRSLFWSGLRLGWLHLLDAGGLAERTADLGVDPLSEAFDAAHLAALLSGRRGALKPLLVDQRLFPGIGNCYADEICWTARLHPLRRVGSLGPGEQASLLAAMQAVLGEAVERGGYTETPFAADDRLSGGYLPHLQVYDRKEEPCGRCGAPVAFAEASGRKVFWCPACQPQDAAVPAGAWRPSSDLQPNLLQ
jgi:formamidopyrimidine-DNA glycosylase